MPSHRSTTARAFCARARTSLPWAACTALALSAGCGSGDLTLDQMDPASVPANPTYEQVFAIIDRQCVSCHQGGDEADAAGSAAAAGARLEDDTDLSTCTAIVAQRDNIWQTIEDNSMPPGALPRLSSEERLTIRRWIDNGAPAWCNRN